MDTSFFFIFTLLFVGYVLGLFISIKPLLLLRNAIRKLSPSLAKIKHFWKSWNDWLFIFLVALSVVLFVYFFGNNLETENEIQTLIVIGTFSSVVFVTLVRNHASRYRNRPIINVKFNDKKSDYYHLSTMRYVVEKCVEYFPTYYIRLEVENIGKRTMKNVEVVLESVEPRPDKFMSLNLSWAGFITPATRPGDIHRNVRIPRGQSRMVDVIEATEPEQTKGFLRKLEREGGFSEEEMERIKRLGEGFRTCSIKPYTFSDIFPAGKYTFKIGIYADGTEPKSIKLIIEYKGEWGVEGIKGMRSNYLRVRIAN